MAAVVKIEIETGRLQSDINSLRSYLTIMRQTGDAMMEGVNALSAMWEGEAKNAFSIQFKSDYETLEAMERVIEDLIGSLEYARDRYNSCENSVGSIINSIRV